MEIGHELRFAPGHYNRVWAVLVGGHGVSRSRHLCRAYWHHADGDSCCPSSERIGSGVRPCNPDLR